MSDHDPAYTATLARQLATRRPDLLTLAEDELQELRNFKATVARFPSRRAARRRARQIRGQGGPRFNAYRCRFCRAVHIGHPPGLATHLRPGPHGPIPVQEYPA